MKLGRVFWLIWVAEALVYINAVKCKYRLILVKLS